MTLQIQHYEQEKDDLEFRKYDFEKDKEKISELQNQIEIQNAQIRYINDQIITKDFVASSKFVQKYKKEKEENRYKRKIKH